MPTPKLVLVYSRGWSIGSPLIRHADRWGAWSHCGLLDADGQHVLESRAFAGVVRTPWPEFLARTTHLEQVDVACPNPAAGLAWAHSQVGKGYDYLAIFGNLVRESWQKAGRWHCAEYVEQALVQAGRQRFRRETWRISPNNSWSVV